MRTRKKEPGTANTIGQTIAGLRKQHGMKQGELAARLQTRGINICRTTLSKLENQTRLVRGEEVAALLEIFRLSLEDLYPK